MNSLQFYSCIYVILFTSLHIAGTASLLDIPSTITKQTLITSPKLASIILTFSI